jgi:hypothetical protein
MVFRETIRLVPERKPHRPAYCQENGRSDSQTTLLHYIHKKRMFVLPDLPGSHDETVQINIIDVMMHSESSGFIELGRVSGL